MVEFNPSLLPWLNVLSINPEESLLYGQRLFRKASTLERDHFIRQVQEGPSSADTQTTPQETKLK